jgi:hypothetical protein
MASLIQQRLLDLATDITTNRPEELKFYHTITCQCAVPSAKPDQGVRIWERRQGRATLLIEAGKVIEPRTGRFVRLESRRSRAMAASISSRVAMLGTVL